MTVPRGDTAVHRIAVVVPVHNEQNLLGECLSSLRNAASHPELDGVAVSLSVVLDSCTDGSDEVAAAFGVPVLAVQARNVGLARAAGADLALAGVDDPDRVWLACTDADSVVAPDWLAVQAARAAAGVDAVAGIVEVSDWGEQPAGVEQGYAAHYARGIRGTVHNHVHGACLGVRASAYLRAGGFAPRRVGEDGLLVAALEALPGVRVERSTALRVTTSARRFSRCDSGFAGFLRGVSVLERPRGALA